jgi:hypothetical protein
MMHAVQLELTQGTDIAAGTECTLAGALYHHGMYVRVIAPILQCTRAGADHRQVDRIQRLRTVQQDSPHTSIPPGNYGLLVWHCNSPDLPHPLTRHHRLHQRGHLGERTQISGTEWQPRVGGDAAALYRSIFFYFFGAEGGCRGVGRLRG